MITGGRFPQILDHFQGLKIGVPSGCLGEKPISKYILWLMTLLCGQSLNLHGNFLLDFINSILQTDDIQVVSARTVSGKVTF